MMAQGEAGGFRRDVEGLRAVAVLMVLLYHIGIGSAPGGFAGVDVFFVISGFLITGLLVRELDTTGRISLVAFYARRAKRLFPAAATVLVATAALSWWLLPATRWREVGGDTFASALYFINWRLAWRSVDYLAEDSVASPLQHFWSLAVEEQYYIVWPVMLAVGLLCLRRFVSVRAMAWTVLAAVGVPSLVWSVHLTRTDPSTAYFVTTTRMWELAIGGVVAIAAARWSGLNRRFAIALGWAGLAAILCSLLFQSTKTPWPGYAAALPTLGAAAVIVSGYAAGGRGPAALLGTRLFCWIGGLSYSLYLWHWPLIAIAKSRLGNELPLPWGMGLLAVSAVLAWLTLRFVENPIRYSNAMSVHPRYALSSGLNFSLIGAVSGLALVLLASQSANPNATSRVAAGAQALRDEPRDDPAGAPVDRVEWMRPSPVDAVEDVPDLYADGCQSPVAGTEPILCEYGRRDGAVTIAVVGDSKMAQWVPALQALAERHSWRIVTYTKSNCGFNSAATTIDGKVYAQCQEWNRRVLAAILAAKPDFVLTSQGRGTAVSTDRKVSATTAMVNGLVDWWSRLRQSGIGIIVLADNPNPGMMVYECVANHPTQMSQCSFERKPGAGTAALRKAADLVPGVRFVDLTDAICPTARCAAVIGNVLIYRQGSHITKTYIESMAPRLERALIAAGVDSVGASRPRAP